MATVTLTQEQRDGLHEFVAGKLSADLGPYMGAGELEKVKSIVAVLPACVRVLDQIGWQDKGPEETYEIVVDSEVQAMIESISANIRGTIQDDQQQLLDAANPEEVERFQRSVNHDVQALAAAGLIQAVA